MMKRTNLILKMRRKGIISRAVKIFICAGVMFCAPVLSAHAQSPSPQPVITWRAYTYAPAGFSGKILAVPRSRMDASLALIDQGKIVNLKNYTVHWYLNDHFIDGGVG